MRKIAVTAVGCVIALGGAALAQQNAVQAAAKALNLDTTYSLQITGSGANFTVGQPYTAGGPWPRVNVKSFTESVNLDTASLRIDMVREMPNPIPPGGGVAFAGEQTQNLFVSGNFAWAGLPPAPPMPDPNARGGGAAAPAAAARGAAAPAAAAGRGAAPARGAAAGAGRGPAAAPPPPAGPAPLPEATVTERKIWYWSIPQAFLKGAIANNATSRKVGANTVVSFTANNKYKLEGTFNAANDLIDVKGWAPSPIFGDMLIETAYSDYKDFGGVRFPGHIVQSEGGQPALDITVTAVRRNPVVSVIIPETVYAPAAAAAPDTVASQEVAPGVFYLTGSSHHSAAIAMKDHIVIVDLPLTPERGAAVIAKAKELIPNKPVRYIVNTHVHFDHSSGLRAGVAEGATIVTHESNRAFYAKQLAVRSTMMADKSVGKPVKLQGVGAHGTLTDGTRRIELYQITPNNHNAGFLMVYLPADKVLFEADLYTPAAAGAPAPTAPNPNAQALADAIAKLKLDVATILPAHGPRTATMADLNAVAAVGRRTGN